MAKLFKHFWRRTRSWLKGKTRWLWRKIHTLLKTVMRWIKNNSLIFMLVVLLLSVFFLLLWRIFDMRDMEHCLDQLLGTSDKYQTLRTLGLAIFGIGALIGLAVAYLRVEAAFQSNRDTIYNNAITHLGHKEASVRLGGAYALYELSELEPGRLKNIAEILCAHVREKTQDDTYKKENTERPSNEVQSILNLLSKLNATYQKKKGKAEILLDLSRTHLNGANLEGANLQHANLQIAEIQDARLYRAQMQEARLNNARMQRARLYRAQMQGARLYRAQMQGINLAGAQMQGAYLQNAQMQGAELPGAQMQGADLLGTQMQGASLYNAQMQEVNLAGAQMQGADLSGTQMQGAFLSYARMQEANLSEARMQEANLSEAQMQGAHLHSAQMQGAGLRSTQMQGADLSGTQMQGANLHNTNMAGAFATESNPILEWSSSQKARIKNRLNKNTELKTVIWSGEKKVGDMERLEKHLRNLVQKGKLRQFIANCIIQRISPHKGKKAKYKPIPQEVITGKLTDETADKVIKDHEEAMKSVPKSNK